MANILKAHVKILENEVIPPGSEAANLESSIDAWLTADGSVDAKSATVHTGDSRVVFLTISTEPE